MRIECLELRRGYTLGYIVHPTRPVGARNHLMEFNDMVIDAFSPAINEMRTNKLMVSGPASFQDYLSKNDIPRRGTAASISIDSYERMPPILKEAEIMVFRLGASQESRRQETQFALVDKPLEDFFLYAGDDAQGSTYLPKVSMRDLFAYQVLPVFSETYLVNLSLASGLVAFALELDQDKPILNPATCKIYLYF